MNILNYCADINKALSNAKFSGYNQKEMSYDSAVEAMVSAIRNVREQNKKLIFVGNGGSAAIVGHMTLDFTKAGKTRSICFNDGPFLTMLGNDFGFENSFAEAINMHANKGDVLIAISSSGKSPNVLNAVAAAKNKGCEVITLSGFDPTNPLFQSGHVNLHLNSFSYGIVETAHETFLHCLLDHIASLQ